MAGKIVDTYGKMRINVQGRSEGDGMENVSFVDPFVASSNAFTKPSNSITYPRSFASNGKIKEPKFVPYEPYKAAISPILSEPKERCFPTKCTIDSEKISLLASNVIRQNSLPLKPEVGDLTLTASKKNKFYEQKCHCECKEKTNYLEHKISQLEKEKKELESQFNIQTQVNKDLKKMLVASVGEDMHIKLQYMIEDKAQLGKYVLDYADERKEKNEEIDKLSTQCNIWKSKFEANSLLVDDLAKWKIILSQKFSDATIAINSLLKEHDDIYKKVESTYGVLRKVQKAFDPNVTMTSPSFPEQWTLPYLVTETHVLCNSIRTRLLGNKCPKSSFFASKNHTFSPAEAYAYQVVSSVDSVILKNIESCRGIKSDFKLTACQLLPHACNKDMPVNCCKHCSGEIILL